MTHTAKMIQPIERENMKPPSRRALMKLTRGRTRRVRTQESGYVTKYTDVLRYTLPFFFIAVLGSAIASFAQPTALDGAQRLFYNGRYQAAADATLPMCAASPGDLAAC